MTKKLLFATSNRGKEKEIRRILSGLQGWELSFLDGFAGKIDPPEETGKDYEENAALKAVHYGTMAGGRFVAAEDSGLSVDALDGAPGIFSARYRGLSEDRDKAGALLEAMKGFPAEKRKARFVAAVCLLSPDGKKRFFRGSVEGTISGSSRGEGGFGYDPVFIPEGFDRTFAEMSADEKDRLSHRRKALEKLKELLVETA